MIGLKHLSFTKLGNSKRGVVILLPTQDKEAINLLAREILIQCWDGSPENAKTAWDTDSGEIDKEPYLKEARAYLALLERLGYLRGLPSSIEEALNSGDGGYKP